MVEPTAKILRIRPLCANLTKLNETEVNKKFFCQLAICDHLQKSSKCENGNLLFWNDEIEFQFKTGELLNVSLWEEDKEEVMIGKGEFQLFSLGEGQTEQWIPLIRDEERVGEVKLGLSLIIPKVEEIKTEVLPEVIREQKSKVETHEIVNPPVTDVEQSQIEAKSAEADHDWEVLQSKSPQTKPPEIVASENIVEEKFIPPEESRQIIRPPTEPQNLSGIYYQAPLSDPYQTSATQSSTQYHQDPIQNQPSMFSGQYYPQQVSSQPSQPNLQEIPHPLMQNQSSEANTQISQSPQVEGHPIPQASTEVSAQPYQTHLQTTEGQTSQQSSENQGQIFQSGPQTPTQPAVQSTPAEAYPTGPQMAGQPYTQMPQYYQPQMPGQYGQPYQQPSQYYNQPYQPSPNQSSQPYQQGGQPYSQIPQQPYQQVSQSYPNTSQPYQSPCQPYQSPGQPYQNLSQQYQNPQIPQSYQPHQPLPPPCFPQNQQGQIPMQSNYPPQQIPSNLSAGMPSGYNPNISGQPGYPPQPIYPTTQSYPPGAYQQNFPYPQYPGSSQQVYQNAQYPSQPTYQPPYGYAPYPPQSLPSQPGQYPGQPQGPYIPTPASSAQQPTSFTAYPPYSSNPNQRS
ncbi:unnamed protein product [Blepharisma stoltei]|uniref:C2 domain-containing protein n=1 Tax=Blepharisma stoltei TaxID=1481888 RepID=A0AAU9J1E1_9CILI|nr:unnamed protein product [Blepharisma stoltei]